MPPFSAAAGATTTTAVLSSKQAAPEPIVTLNVGGQLFQTTPQTLALAGPHSLLSSPPSFIDRDPSLFAALLSLLRSPRRRPSSLSDDLLAEADFYGLSHLLHPPSPSLFDAFSLRRSLALPLPGRHPSSAISASPSGSLLAAHAGNLTLFDPSLRRRSTILTPLPAIDSLLLLPHSPLAAAGAVDFPALHLFHLNHPSPAAAAHTLTWASHPSSTSTVQAIAASPDNLLFASFESSRRNASAVLAFDLHTLLPTAEVGRREVFGADLVSAIPATNLQWIPGFNLIMAAGSHAGPSGLLGNIRLFDIRSPDTVVFELNEKLDCFADITVSDQLSAMFKVGANSGEVFIAELRKLSTVEPWIGIGGGGQRKAMAGRKEGSGCRIKSHGRQVFCSRGGEVEVWSEVAVGGSRARRMEDGLDGERVMRRNVMGRAEDTGRSKIMQMAFGGDRMVLARKDEHVVEVWESSNR